MDRLLRLLCSNLWYCVRCMGLSMSLTLGVGVGPLVRTMRLMMFAIRRELTICMRLAIGMRLAI